MRSRRWMDRAVCAQMPTRTADALFYAETGRGVAGTYAAQDLARAREICDRCPVQYACLADALASPERLDRFGVRAGLLPRERATLRAPEPDSSPHARDEEALRWLGGEPVPRGQRRRARGPTSSG